MGFEDLKMRLSRAQRLLAEAREERDSVRVDKAHTLLAAMPGELASALALNKVFVPTVGDLIEEALGQLAVYRTAGVTLEEDGKPPHPDDVDDAALEGALQALRRAVEQVDGLILLPAA